MSTRTLLIALVIALFAVMPAHAARQALVIGNDNYTSVSKLQKAGNDATAMARELKAAGFTVQLHRDLNYRSMVRTVETFTAGIKGGDEVVVFFAGHGVQIKNGAYLLPTDIEATTESEVEKTSYELNALTEKLSDAKAAFSLVMVDACRDNPLKAKGRSVGNTRGLSAIEPPKGQMVVYSASKGQQALDRLSDKDANPNSVFTREFISRMKRPGVRIEDLVREVQDAVEMLAGTVQHEQRPALYNEARGNFYFFGPTTVQTMPVKPEALTSDAQVELQGWAAAQAGNTAAGYTAYLDEYPKGRFASAARIARASLQAKVTEEKAATDKAEMSASAKASADKASADKLAADKVAADKAVSDKATADRIVGEKTAAEKLATEKAAADKAASEKAAADRVASDKAVADRAKVDQLAADKLVSDMATANRIAAEKAVADMAATKAAADIAEKAAAAKVAADKIVADRVLAEKAAEEKAAAVKAASDKAKANTDKLALDKVVSDKPVAPAAGQTIKDCADCPEMVVIPAGSFRMGSPDSERERHPDGREGPVHEVQIGYSFALGKHELTLGEFSRFAAASGYKTEAELSRGCIGWSINGFAYDARKNWRNPGFAQTDSHPVVCISWNDAQAYLTWLNGRVPGNGFRLPSEAEWEYAARAGQGAVRYPWGDDFNYSQICDFANVMDATSKAQVLGVNWAAASCSDGHAYTAPAGSFKANAFGLYDMHGNAWEWVQDVGHVNYQGAPGDGSAWVNGGDQAQRVRRGSAWNGGPSYLRSSSRNLSAPDYRSVVTGMRIARTN